MIKQKIKKTAVTPRPRKKEILRFTFARYE